MGGCFWGENEVAPSMSYFQHLLNERVDGDASFIMLGYINIKATPKDLNCEWVIAYITIHTPRENKIDLTFFEFSTKRTLLLKIELNQTASLAYFA